MTVRQNPISVAVLAGGQSRRLGTDKALLRLELGGPTLTEMVIDRLTGLSDDLFIVSPPRPGYGDFGVPVIADRFADTGPLGAIATALMSARYEICLIVSCDMPFLNRELLLWMIARPRTYDLLVPQLHGESRQGGASTMQSMHALYARTCLPAIERALSRGDRRTTSFLEDVRVETVSEALVRTIDPQAESFTSINSPAELAFARDLLRSRQVVP